ncbi:MAG: orotate phosphoribosyltransferase [Deltaproteobacteria bacterium]|nr:orotate phosphoribosyltransferase [Kofleriaceae bacterium]
MSLDALFAEPVFAQQRGRLLDLLRVHAFAEREVTLSSGARSNFYIDTKRVSLDAEGGYLVGQLFRRMIDEIAPAAGAVGGLTLGADPLATATSIASFHAVRPLHAFIVRKEPKGHGTGQWLESAARIDPARPVVVLEDVVTTGASTQKAIERAVASGLRVAAVIALVDRLEGGRDAVTPHAPLYPLFTRKDFLP